VLLCISDGQMPEHIKVHLCFCLMVFSVCNFSMDRGVDFMMLSFTTASLAHDTTVCRNDFHSLLREECFAFLNMKSVFDSHNSSHNGVQDLCDKKHKGLWAFSLKVLLFLTQAAALSAPINANQHAALTRRPLCSGYHRCQAHRAALSY